MSDAVDQALSKLLEEYPLSSCSSNGGVCTSCGLEILINEGISAPVREGAPIILPGDHDDTNDQDDVVQERRDSDLISPLENVVKITAADDHENHKISNVSNVADQESGLIGAIVAKVLGGVRYIGHVTGYEAEFGRFKIIYENNYQESVEKEELLQMFASHDLVRTYYNRVATGGRPRKTRRRKKAAKARQDKIDYIPAKRVPRAKKESTYIPLAFRETRKDAYYWY
ncbi:uncharacterized protein LOC121248957 [Juglans microcarpa x Juglans regia]|uniref:uncharacterized protein LOC121248957 n=1 Tax=Juglans microcarpa x Juglans regia TaxID=2249226 RepID=UPI001B7EE242|nr:uncharacterized protein LOC121248957 [Juglans microcarpa x Juglans regia]